jgi:hypothetical protein
MSISFLAAMMGGEGALLSKSVTGSHTLLAAPGPAIVAWVNATVV